MSNGFETPGVDPKFRMWLLTHLAEAGGLASPAEVAAVRVLARLSTEAGSSARISPNGRFAVSTRPGMGSKGGPWIAGHVIAADLTMETVLFEARFQRPNEAYPSNDGQVLVEDGLLEDYRGALHMLDASGNRLWRRDFDANLFGSGLSGDGSRAFACLGAVPGAGPHGLELDPRMELLDGRTGQSLWTRPCRNPDQLKYSGNVLVLVWEGEEFSFDEEGYLPWEFE